MCARFSQILPREAMEALFGVDVLSNLEPRYNVAPSQEVLTVRDHDGARETPMLKWGLVPSWAKDPAIGHRTVNARSESLAEKPAFRSAFKVRRCVIPADGFYEWDKSVKARPAYRFHLKDGGLMALAGLWERNERLGLTTFTIITCPANEHLEAIGHDRMGVIVSPENVDAWLDPATGTGDIHEMIRPYPAAKMERYMVSAIVNSPKNDGPECIAPAAGPAQGDLFG